MITSLTVPGCAQLINPYHSLDESSRNAVDGPSIQRLFQLIYGTTFFGELPSAMITRLTRAQQQAMRDPNGSVNEAGVADAINMLGSKLGHGSFTPTNATQVRLLRVSLYPDLPQLLRSPIAPPTDSIVGSDLSPAGGVFLSFLLLRQKLVNPYWVGDPDEQNARWIKKDRPSISRAQTSLRITPMSPNEFQLEMMIAKELKDGRGKTIAAFNRFFDLLGIPQ